MSKKTRYVDPFSPILDFGSIGDPPQPPGFTASKADDYEENRSLAQRQLAAIGEFCQKHSETEVALMKDYLIWGKSVRELAKDKRYSRDPGTIFRWIIRILEKMRLYVLAVSQEFLLGSSARFTLCPVEGSLVEGVDRYAIGLKETDETFRFAPSRAQCHQFLSNVWKPLSDSYCDAFENSLSDRYLGGWISDDGLYKLNVSILIEDFQLAKKIAWENNQHSIYNLLTGETIDILPPAQVA